jgi:hypothetical protein
MPQFQPGQTIESDDPTMQVEMDPAQPLRVGRHRFQLVVVDDSNNESAPAFCDVIVIDNNRPTAVITPAEITVPAGQNFRLSGAQSTDIGGRVVRYRWTLIQ